MFTVYAGNIPRITLWTFYWAETSSNACTLPLKLALGIFMQILWSWYPTMFEPNNIWCLTNYFICVHVVKWAVTKDNRMCRRTCLFYIKGLIKDEICVLAIYLITFSSCIHKNLGQLTDAALQIYTQSITYHLF